MAARSSGPHRSAAPVLVSEFLEARLNKSFARRSAWAALEAIVWAHNSHIGDARYTEMGVVTLRRCRAALQAGTGDLQQSARGEELNIGQLCRHRFGNGAALIGFGTHTGTVAAATDWDGDMKVKRVRPSHRDSYERLCHDTGVTRFLLDLGRDEALRRRLLEPKLWSPSWSASSASSIGPTQS